LDRRLEFQKPSDFRHFMEEKKFGKPAGTGKLADVLAQYDEPSDLKRKRRGAVGAAGLPKPI
jgi:hypothetical protein